MCGLICANFGVSSVGHWTCNSVWQAGCYVQCKRDNFLISAPIDLDGSNAEALGIGTLCITRSGTLPNER